MDEKQPDVTWATVNVEDRHAMANLDEKEDRQAESRVKEAVQRLQRQGILDENGRRIRHSTPPDMQDGSKTEFGG